MPGNPWHKWCFRESNALAWIIRKVCGRSFETQLNSLFRRSQGSISILVFNLGWDDEYTAKAIPSWVPRWDQSKSNNTHSYHFARFFNACDKMCGWLDFDLSDLNESCVGQDLDVLPFVGLYIDAVGATPCVLDETNNSGEDLANTLDILKTLRTKWATLPPLGELQLPAAIGPAKTRHPVTRRNSVHGFSS